jgi:hypothetical protein
VGDNGDVSEGAGHRGLELLQCEKKPAILARRTIRSD